MPIRTASLNGRIKKNGAKLHLAAGLDAGLTKREVTEALLQTMMLHGVKTWGLGGHQLVAFADSYRGGPAADDEAATQ